MLIGDLVANNARRIPDQEGLICEKERITWAQLNGRVNRLANGLIDLGLQPVYKDFLILRLGEKGSQEALESPFVRPFDITGKPMKGWVIMEMEGFKSDRDLSAWLNRAKENL